MSYFNVLKKARDLSKSFGQDTSGLDAGLRGMEAGGVFSEETPEVDPTMDTEKSKFARSKEAVNSLAENIYGMRTAFSNQRSTWVDEDEDLDGGLVRDAKTFANRFLDRSVSETLDKVTNYEYTLPKNIASDKAFKAKTTRIAKKLGLKNPEDLFAVMHFETDGTFSPSVKNYGGSSGTGLIQFMAPTARSLGTTVEELAKMSAIDQLDYVEKYLSQYDLKDADRSDLYMAILWPRAIGKDGSYSLWSRGSAQYKANSGLDIDGDGKITKDEAVKKVNDRWNTRKT